MNFEIGVAFTSMILVIGVSFELLALSEILSQLKAIRAKLDRRG